MCDMYNFLHAFSHVSDGFNALRATLGFPHLSFALRGPLKKKMLDRGLTVYIFLTISLISLISY